MFKNIIRQTITAFCSLIPYNRLQQAAGHKLVVVNYHSLLNSDQDSRINRQPYRTAEEFERDLIFFKRHHHVVDLKTIIEHGTHNQPLPPNSLAITFDDGLAVVYHSIRPIMLKYGVRATIFINPAFIDQAELHYKRKINLIIDLLHREPKHLSVVQTLLKEAPLSAKNTLSTIEGLGYHQKHLVDKMVEALHIDINQYLKEKAIYLTTQQINTMIDEGFTFGAHSWDHPDYRHLSIEEQTDQTIKSMNWVVRQFRLHYKVFAFPYRDYHLKQALFRNIRQETDLTFGTHGMVDDAMPCHLQRVDVERSGLNCCAAMKINYLKYLTLKMMGKKQLKRQ